MNTTPHLAALMLAAMLPLAATGAEPRTATTDNPPSREKSVGEYVDDAAITAKVKSAFVRDNEVKALDIRVETYKGVVQLSGFARNTGEAQRALELARGVPGVRSVRNDIQVR